MAKQSVEEEVDAKLDDVDDSLVDKVQASLDAINGEDVEEDNTDDQQAGDDDPTPDGETENTEDPKNEKDTEEVQLPDAYYRAAIHQGWKPDEIKEFFEANPELAIKTLAKNHESINKLNSEFARMGRIKPEDKVADPGTATEAIAATSIDMDAIKEQYGDDSAIVKAMTAMQAKLNSIPEQQIVERIAPVQHDDPMRATVDKFFTDPTVKPYKDFYGEGVDTAL